MSWKCVIFSPQGIAAGRKAALQNAFASLWMAAGAPPDAAMYGAKSVRDGRCFFTPAAGKLAGPLLQNYGAVDCAEPDLRALIVLVKNEGAPHNE